MAWQSRTCVLLVAMLNSPAWAVLSLNRKLRQRAHLFENTKSEHDDLCPTRATQRTTTKWSEFCSFCLEKEGEERGKKVNQMSRTGIGDSNYKTWILKRDLTLLVMGATLAMGPSKKLIEEEAASTRVCIRKTFQRNSQSS